MASEACSLVLGCGWIRAMPRTTRFSIFMPSRSLAVSCKMRQKHFSSQKRQQIKRDSREQLRPNINSESHNNGNGGSQKASSDGLSNGGQESVLSNDADYEHDSKDMAASAVEETKSEMVDEVIQEHPSIPLEDLKPMIGNVEKNVSFLNQAQVGANQELDKILSDKEALQAEINILEMKLAETNARIKVAAQEKINVELLEGQLEKLKEIAPSGSGSMEGNHSSFSGEFPIVLELNALRKEYSVVKADIQTLKLKLNDVIETEKRVLLLEKECCLLDASLTELQSQFTNAQVDVARLSSLPSDHKALSEKVENLLGSVDSSNKEDRDLLDFSEFVKLQQKVDKLEASLSKATMTELPYENFRLYEEILQQKIESFEKRLQVSDQEIHSQIQLFQESVREFQDTLDKLQEDSKKRSQEQFLENLPWEFWSHLLLLIDGWLLEKKISANDAKSLRDMAWKKDSRIRDAYLACESKGEHERLTTFLKLTYTSTRPGLHIIHIAAEMAPIAKVGGLGDVITGLGKALQRKGHLVEIVLPKYDCIQYDLITDLKELDVVIESYFDGRLFRNKIWVGTVEGLPVYFIEPHHPAKFFWRGTYYGEHDDFKRFSFFSRAALELLYEAEKRPDIIHCHDWQTAFVAPLYWDIYAAKGLNSARICFTCHNFEHQGTAPASELSSCGLDVHHMNRSDRMQDNSAHDRVNPVKGAIVFSNIVTTVSPTYAQEVCTAEGGRGLHETLKSFSKKFVGILNGIDTDAWNPSTDKYISTQYHADDLQGKAENKNTIRKHLKLSWSNSSQPLMKFESRVLLTTTIENGQHALVKDEPIEAIALVSSDTSTHSVGCITRLVPQKGVHLIRHAIYRTLELGGQFVLLGSSPVLHIQREFEDIAIHFNSHPDVRLLLKYDNALSHLIYAASDMFIIPSLFEPCGLTQMIAMRYGSVPIVRKTGGLNDSVFDVDDNTVPEQYRNGFTFLPANEQGLSSVMGRAFQFYSTNPEGWQQLVQKDMTLDFSWDSSASQYEELYERSVTRARTAAARV